jgi:tRNA(His) 5'-end guanylyltransferase
MSTKHHDNFGDRMKTYEKVFTEQKLDTSLPIYARLDGRSFSSFTRRMKRPFDRDMSACMQDTTEYLAYETKALLGYTQSDEISLIWEPCEGPSQFMFDGKIQKLASVLAAMCAAKFTLSYCAYFGEEPKTIPSFDCRIINVPTMDEANNMILWRQQDAFKNSVQSAAHYLFGHSKLMGKNTREKLEMIKAFGIDFFEEHAACFRVGTEISRITEERMLTINELATIPFEHHPTKPVIRTRMVRSNPLRIEEKYRHVESGISQP